MAYRLTHAGPDGVRVQRTAAAMVIPVVGSFFGAIFLLIGAGTFLGGGWSREAIAFVIGGAFFLTLPWYLIRAISRLQPEEVTFDNATACCYVIGGAGDFARRGAIPYDTIDSFGYRPRTVLTTSSGPMAPVSHSTYDVCCYRRDGSVFVLIASMGGELAAQVCVAALGQFVELDRRPSRIALGDLPPRVMYTQSREMTEFRWKAPVPVGMIGFLFFFFLCFFGLAATMSRIGSADAAFSTAVTFIGGVGVIVAIGVTVSVFLAARERMFVRIGQREVTAGVERGSGQIRRQTTLPLSDVVAVSTDFVAETSAHHLTIRTSAFAAEAKQLREATPADLSWKESLTQAWGAAMREAALPRVETGMMPLAALIAFENHVNLELAKRKGADSPFVVGAVERYGWWSRRQDSAGRRSLIARLLTNEILGTASLVASAMPVLLIGVLLVFRRAPFMDHAGQVISVLTVIQLVIAALASWKLTTSTRHRLLGSLTGVATLLRTSAMFTVELFPYTGSLALGLCILMALAGARLLTTPEPDQLRVFAS